MVHSAASLLASLEAQKVDGLMWETLLFFLVVGVIGWLAWKFIDD
jgi:hypothetical protein